jgi:glycosyltransferase involved in cell wall biosynthesis
VISVVMPTRNGAGTIDAQLSALARQTYQGAWELVIVDNGSTDETRSIAASWQARIPDMQLVVGPSHPLGTGAAKNLGARHARGDVFVFCDHDDVARDGWLAAMADAMTSADLAAGAIEFRTLNAPGSARSDERPLLAPAVALGFLPFAIGANLAVSRAAFEAVGGFREERPWGADDVDLSWKLQLAGYPLRFVPDAVIDKRARPRPRDLWRQQVRWGEASVDLYRRYRDHGLCRRWLPGVFSAYAQLLVRVPACRRLAGRRQWVRDAAVLWGRLTESIRTRTLFL